MEQNLSEKLYRRIEQMMNLMQSIQRGMRMDWNGPRGMAQERALRAIGEREGISQRELMVDMNLRPSSMSELLSRMESSEIVERRTDENDKRVSKLYLRQKGRAMLDHMGENFTPDFFAALDDEQKRAYIGMTEQIIAGLLETCDEMNIRIPEPCMPRNGRPDMPPPPFPGAPDHGMPPRGPFPGGRPMPPELRRFEHGGPMTLEERNFNGRPEKL